MLEPYFVILNFNTSRRWTRRRRKVCLSKKDEWNKNPKCPSKLDWQYYLHFPWVRDAQSARESRK